jgi:3-phenylpropionate/cinnamic acid dioxygenase small subunit
MAQAHVPAAERHEQGGEPMSAQTAVTSNLGDPKDCAPGTPLYSEVVGFLYREAKLLDSCDFGSWIELFADDIRYTMPVRTTQLRKTGDGFHEISFFEDNLVSLQTRVQRLLTEMAWAETPPSRTRHFITNILVEPAAKPSELKVESSFLITRTRADRDYQMFTGLRADVLRRLGDRLKIASRRILVDQTVITGTNLSILF